MSGNVARHVTLQHVACRNIALTRRRGTCTAQQRRQQQQQQLLHLHGRPHQARRQRQQRGTALACTAAAAVPVAVIAAAASAGSTSALAVAVGWLVVAGSCFRSVPQIVRVVKANSVEGLSVSAFTTEALSCLVSVAYNLHNAYPFSSYGDTAICLAQNLAIIALIFHYNRQLSRRMRLGTVACLAASAGVLFSGVCSGALLATLEAGTVVMLAGARIPQIVLNLKRGDTGELSIASTGLVVIGNAMRVFTTLVLVKDPLILSGYALQLVLTSIMLAQTLATHRRRQTQVQHGSGGSGAPPMPAAA